MRKMIFTLLVLWGVAISPAFAADDRWAKVMSFVGVKTVYLDALTVSRKGDTVKLWILEDHVKGEPIKPLRKTAMSNVRLQEVDCQGRRVRILKYTFSQKSMGNGNPIHSMKGSNEWDDVLPGSIGEGFIDLVCKLKLDDSTQGK